MTTLVTSVEFAPLPSLHLLSHWLEVALHSIHPTNGRKPFGELSSRRTPQTPNRKCGTGSQRHKGRQASRLLGLGLPNRKSGNIPITPIVPVNECNGDVTTIH